MARFRVVMRKAGVHRSAEIDLSSDAERETLHELMRDAIGNWVEARVSIARVTGPPELEEAGPGDAAASDGFETRS